MFGKLVAQALGAPEEDVDQALDMMRVGLQKAIWHKCEDGRPDDFYLKNHLDWVLVQFEEPGGFRGVPKVAEWVATTEEWFFECDEMNELDYYRSLKAVAYMQIQRYEETLS